MSKREETLFFFNRRKKQMAPAYAPSVEYDESQLYRIDFEMMLKGSIYKRRKGVVRQFGVTVNGSTRLVTSGDLVDRDTYRALVAAGAIRPIVPDPTLGKKAESLDFTATEHFED